MTVTERLAAKGIDIGEYSAADLSRIYDEYVKISKNYGCAIREVRTKLDVLNEDFELLHKHNPIHYMESRVKSIDSIIEKIIRRGFSTDITKISEEVLDIAGIRVICHYIEDIYTIAELLKKQEDIILIKERDYIKDPKPNGYRSLHLVISVPVFFVTGIQQIPVEVQIRTIAMDFWASLEHKLRYKSNGEIPKFIADDLLECANNITQSDLKMQRIHRFLEELEKQKLLFEAEKLTEKQKNR